MQVLTAQATAAALQPGPTRPLPGLKQLGPGRHPAPHGPHRQPYSSAWRSALQPSHSQPLHGGDKLAG